MDRDRSLNGEDDDDVGRDEAQKVAKVVDQATRERQAVGDVHQLEHVVLAQLARVDVQVGAQRVLEEVREQEEAVRDGQKEQIDARRVHAETLLRKHVDGEAVADEPDDDDEDGAYDVDLARERVNLVLAAPSGRSRGLLRRRRR